MGQTHLYIIYCTFLYLSKLKQQESFARGFFLNLYFYLSLEIVYVLNIWNVIDVENSLIALVAQLMDPVGFQGFWSVPIFITMW